MSHAEKRTGGRNIIKNSITANLQRNTLTNVSDASDASEASADTANSDFAAKVAKISEIIEKCCFNHTLDMLNEQNLYKKWSDAFNGIYSSQLYRVVSNLEYDYDNIGWLNKLLAGEITPQDFANMSSEKMSPITSEKTKEELERRCNQKIEYKVAKNYKCRCGSKSIQMQTYQGSAPDELHTIKGFCLDCQQSVPLR